MDKTKTKRLTIYGTMISQPVRTVVCFCQLNNIDYDFILINLQKGEHLKKEFTKINPRSKLPAIKYVTDEGKDFYLDESFAIIRFLASVYKTDDQWYPRIEKNVFRRAKIDLYLDWHHLNIRHIFMNAVFLRILLPFLQNTKNAPVMEDTYRKIPSTLKYLNNLLSEQKYIVDNEISIADIALTNEINQTRLIGIDLTPYEHLHNYIQNINNLEQMTRTNKDLENLIKKLGDIPTAKF